MSRTTTFVLNRLRVLFSSRSRRLPFTFYLFLFLSLVFFSTHFTFRRSCGRDVRLAFSIQASASSADRVPRLLDALWDPCNLYAVHFDANIPPTSRRSITSFLTHKYPRNVLVVPSRAVTYAGVSMLLATLDSISALLRNIDIEWTFFINLSANDYPLLPPPDLRNALSKRDLRGVNFFQPQTASNDDHWFFSRRFESIHFDPSLWNPITDTHNPSSPLHKSPPGVTHPFARENLVPLRKAEGWVILSRDFARYSVDSADSRSLLALFANTRASDEHYFPTLQAMATEQQGEASSSTSFPAVWDAMRYIAWNNGTRLLSRPAWLDGALESVHKYELFESGALFARKFRGDTQLLNEIDCSLSDLSASCTNQQWSTNIGQRHRERVERRLGCIIESRGKSGDGRAMIEDCLNGSK